MLATKILVPFYFCQYFATRRFKGIALLSAIVAIYLGISWAIGNDPLNFEFGRELGMTPADGESLNPLMESSDSGLDVLSSHNLHVGTFFGRSWPVWLVSFFFVVGMAYVRSLMIESDIRAAIALIPVFTWGLHAFYPLFYTVYWIPALPFVFATLFMREDKKFLRLRIVLLVILSFGEPWTGLSCLKFLEPCFPYLHVVRLVLLLALIVYSSSGLIKWPLNSSDSH